MKNVTRNVILILIGSFLVLACHDKRQPSASEVFNLRSKCADLADKIVAKDFDIGTATWDRHLTHYDPITNRCYVRVDAYYNDRRFTSTGLYDGQTGELLVWLQATDDGQKWGGIVNDKLNEGNAAAAEAKIVSLMTDDKKQ